MLSFLWVGPLATATLLWLSKHNFGTKSDVTSFITLRHNTASFITLRQHLNSIGSICCQHALLLRNWPWGWCSCRTGQDNTEYIPSNYDALTRCHYNAMPMSHTIGRHEIMLWVCWRRWLHYYTYTPCAQALFAARLLCICLLYPHNRSTSCCWLLGKQHI